jgi:hypothetical protein
MFTGKSKFLCVMDWVSGTVRMAAHDVQTLADHISLHCTTAVDLRSMVGQQCDGKGAVCVIGARPVSHSLMLVQSQQLLR